jgi:hypothetical protein
LLKFRVGGMIPVTIDITEKIASTPPAAPSKWPVADFVALIAAEAFLPKTALIAASSPRSPTGVEVECALI